MAIGATRQLTLNRARGVRFIARSSVSGAQPRTIPFPTARGRNREPEANGRRYPIIRGRRRAAHKAVCKRGVRPRLGLDPNWRAVAVWKYVHPEGGAKTGRSRCERSEQLARRSVMLGTGAVLIVGLVTCAGIRRRGAAARQGGAGLQRGAWRDAATQARTVLLAEPGRDRGDGLAGQGRGPAGATSDRALCIGSSIPGAPRRGYSWSVRGLIAEGQVEEGMVGLNVPSSSILGMPRR